MRMDKLTSKFQMALADAQSLAVGRDHQFIEPIHVMAALLEQDSSTVRHLFATTGCNVDLLVSKLLEELDRLYWADAERQVTPSQITSTFWQDFTQLSPSLSCCNTSREVHRSGQRSEEASKPIRVASWLRRIHGKSIPGANREAVHTTAGRTSQEAELRGRILGFLETAQHRLQSKVRIRNRTRWIICECPASSLRDFTSGITASQP